MNPPLAVSGSVLDIRGAALHREGRELWSGLDLAVEPGEFIAVLGPSGSGKTTMLQAILGMQQLSAGSIRVCGDTGVGHRPHRGDQRIGYIPQQSPFAQDTSLRARDVVSLGLHGPRFGLPVPRRGDRERVDEILRDVGAQSYAQRPVGLLSGGEQQRLRIGQALVDHPRLLLCDEPLSNLDMGHQRAVVEIIDRQRRERGAAVIFVTHDINPILAKVDRILYIVQGGFVLGSPEQVLQTSVLSELYGAPVSVLRAGGQLVVVGIPDAEHHHHGEGAA